MTMTHNGMRIVQVLAAIEKALNNVVADRPDLKAGLQKAADEATEYEVWNLLGALGDRCSKK
jgi:hypothetical protein